jgi:hypothetical protein
MVSFQLSFIAFLAFVIPGCFLLSRIPTNIDKGLVLDASCEHVANQQNVLVGIIKEFKHNVSDLSSIRYVYLSSVNLIKFCSACHFCGKMGSIFAEFFISIRFN